jgi:hypothetical protein
MFSTASIYEFEEHNFMMHARDALTVQQCSILCNRPLAAVAIMIMEGRHASCCSRRTLSDSCFRRIDRWHLSILSLSHVLFTKVSDLVRALFLFE